VEFSRFPGKLRTAPPGVRGARGISRGSRPREEFVGGRTWPGGGNALRDHHPVLSTPGTWFEKHIGYPKRSGGGSDFFRGRRPIGGRLGTKPNPQGWFVPGGLCSTGRQRRVPAPRGSPSWALGNKSSGRTTTGHKKAVGVEKRGIEGREDDSEGERKGGERRIFGRDVDCLRRKNFRIKGFFFFFFFFFMEGAKGLRREARAQGKVGLLWRWALFLQGKPGRPFFFSAFYVVHLRVLPGLPAWGPTTGTVSVARSGAGRASPGGGRSELFSAKTERGAQASIVAGGAPGFIQCWKDAVGSTQTNRPGTGQGLGREALGGVCGRVPFCVWNGLLGSA